MSITINCPICHKPNEVPSPDIGRFATCEHCKEPYYVVVPPLDSETRSKEVGSERYVSRAVPSVRTTVSDLSREDRFIDCIRGFERILQINMYLQFITLLIVGYLMLRSFF